MIIIMEEEEKEKVIALRNIEKEHRKREGNSAEEHCESARG